MDAVWWAWTTAGLALLAAGWLALAVARLHARVGELEARVAEESAGAARSLAIPAAGQWLEESGDFVAFSGPDVLRSRHLFSDEAGSGGAGGFETVAARPPQPTAGRPPQPAAPQPGRFADLALRETVVVAASWFHGVRRALRPEARNRMAFAMRQEVKRSRRQRKLDLREARRQLREDLRGRERAA